jgi:molybdenum cofactor cytidylyltransferase
MICAVILAAGESKRMGTPKLLLPFGKNTIIETIVDTLLQSKIDKILVVLGSNRDKIKSKISSRPVLTTANLRYKEGMLSSIQAGFRALPKKTEAVLVFLGDQPLIPSSVIDKLIAGYKKSKKGIFIPVFEKKRGHPILVDFKYKPEIEKLNPDIGLRALVFDHPDDLQEVEVDTPHILKDIDKPEDYKRDLEAH